MLARGAGLIALAVVLGAAGPASAAATGENIGWSSPSDISGGFVGFGRVPFHCQFPATPGITAPIHFTAQPQGFLTVPPSA